MVASIVGGRVVLPDGTIDAGYVEVDEGRITAVERGSPPAAAAHGDWTVLPGFVDIHVHGGGGHTVTTGDPVAVAGSVAFHRRHGTTTTLISLVTAPLQDLVAATERIVSLLADRPELRSQVAGVHLEGPFLATGRCGAQNPAYMIDPSPDAVERLIGAGAGELRVVTIAPERPGALDAIRRFVAAGVVAAVGHTDATFDETEAALDAGATLATHLGNAMSPLHHRAPGAIGACLASPSVVCELIVDGQHLHPGMVRLAAESKPESGIALITDAISATGAGDGRYLLGTLEVEVHDGVARLTHGGSLAGSTLTMDVAFRNAISCGLSIAAASRAASLNPAGVLGLEPEVGSIEVGKRANLVVLDAELGVVAVLVDGIVVEGSLEGA